MLASECLPQLFEGLCQAHNMWGTHTTYSQAHSVAGDPLSHNPNRTTGKCLLTALCSD